MTINGDDYKAIFSKVKEHISCGPSGINMPHWKIAATDETLSLVYMLSSCQRRLSLASATKNGNIAFIVCSWNLGIPFIHQIIQLFEGHFNGRRLMAYGDTTKQNSEATKELLSSNDPVHIRIQQTHATSDIHAWSWCIRIVWQNGKRTSIYHQPMPRKHSRSRCVSS